MEPKLPTPNPSPEAGHYAGQERTVQPITPEDIGRSKPEAQPSAESREQQPGAGGPAEPVATVQVPVAPAPAVPQTDPVGQPPVVSGTPMVAADDELIEKEWVDKAKKIVENTRDDPYNQEKEVSRLQADYISKRYGKSIKLTSD